jgi:hypothetical protein
MTGFLLTALVAFYVGVLLGFDPIIALGGATLMTVARATLWAVLLGDE